MRIPSSRHEFGRNITVLGCALALAIGASACGAEQAPTKTQEPVITEVEYPGYGHRHLLVLSSAIRNEYQAQVIDEYCKNKSFYIRDTYYDFVPNADAVSNPIKINTSAGRKACEDNKITPSDPKVDYKFPT